MTQDEELLQRAKEARDLAYIVYLNWLNCAPVQEFVLPGE